MKQSVPIHVRQPDGSYITHHDLPVWFMLMMSAIVVVTLLGGLFLLFSAVEWTHEAFTEFDRRDVIIQACLESEHYKSAQCNWIANEWKDIGR